MGGGVCLPTCAGGEAHGKRPATGPHSAAAVAKPRPPLTRRSAGAPTAAASNPRPQEMNISASYVYKKILDLTLVIVLFRN